MNNQDRKRRIYEIHKAHPSWTYQDIGELVGLSRERVRQIVREIEERGIIDNEMTKNTCQLNREPISASQAARETRIPYSTIANWVAWGQVKVINHPGHGGRSNPVLLDPLTLQERIDRYQPRRNRVSA